jgi:hypothetical protein
MWREFGFKDGQIYLCLLPSDNRYEKPFFLRAYGGISCYVSLCSIDREWEVNMIVDSMLGNNFKTIHHIYGVWKNLPFIWINSVRPKEDLHQNSSFNQLIDSVSINVSLILFERKDYIHTQILQRADQKLDWNSSENVTRTNWKTTMMLVRKEW